MWDSSFSIPDIVRFDFFMLSQLSWMFSVRKFLDLTFFDQCLYFVHFIFNAWDSLSDLFHFAGDACVCSYY